MKHSIFIPVIALMLGACSHHEAKLYTNPVIESNFPDPTLLKADD